MEITSDVLESPIIYATRENTDNVPINHKSTLTGLDMALKDNGEYTIRLLHQSAFETLNFGEVTITVDRLMRVRSRSSSAEKQEPLVIQIAKTKSARVDPALFLALAEARQKSARRN